MGSLEETVTVQRSATASQPAATIEIPRQVGRVRIGERVGAGATGEVYSAFDEALHRRVAVKVLLQRLDADADSAIEALIAGVRAAAGIRHPNIVGVHQVEVVCGVPVIVMEFVDGVPLSTLMGRAGPVDTPLALHVIRAVSRGVAVLHEHNLIHRDIKPANVLFDRGGDAYVCDFGLACPISDRARVAGTNLIAGSPLYMAPEAFEGIISPQSDVYALGAILFQLLTGDAPFRAESIGALRGEHTNAPVPVEKLLPLKLPEALVDCIERSLHKQRILRYKSAVHFLRAIEGISLRGPTEHQLRERVVQLVMGGVREAESDRMSPAPPTSAPSNTFDLISETLKKRRGGQ